MFKYNTLYNIIPLSYLSVGCVANALADMAEEFKCYSVNNENYCFYMNGSVMSWDKAREFCMEKNSTLPIITDENIDNVFLRFIVNDLEYSLTQNSSVWLDARRVNNDVKWHWINGQSSGTDNTSEMIELIKWSFSGI